MTKLHPSDIDDDLFMYYEETGKEPTDWEQVTFFDEETDLAVVSVNQIHGAVNRNGEAVIPIIYEDAMHFSEGLLAVKKDGKWGYLDQNHNITIPFEYDNLYTYGSTVDSIFIYNGFPKGTADYFRNGITRVRKGQNMGIINTKNEVLFPFYYIDIASFTDKYLSVSKYGAKYGLVDYDNNTILPEEFDFLAINGDVINFGKSGNIDGKNIDTTVNFFKVADGKLVMHGIMDFQGNEIVPAISAAEINNFMDGKAMCFDYHKNESFIFDVKTKEKIYAPEDLKEDETETVRVNFIRNLMGMEPVSYN